MKPRTKLHHQVIAMSNSIPHITATQEQWGLRYCLQHKAYRTKKTVGCLDCGHIWPGPQKVKKCICPSCGTTLTVEDSLKKKFSQKMYMCILDTINDVQIIRFFEILRQQKIGEEPRGSFREVIQQFIMPNGKLEVVALNRSFNFNVDSFNGSMEIRSTQSRWGGGNKYDLWPDKIYPKFEVLPTYERNGFKGKIEGISPLKIFKNILDDSISETLLKAKQFGFLAARVGSKSNEVYRHWDSIKICIRSKYVVNIDDSIMYLDYLDLLKYFSKDLRSPKYVCPTDIKDAHDMLMAKKREIQRIRQIEQDLEREERNRLAAEERLLEIETRRTNVDLEQAGYIEAKSGYFGLVFVHKNLTIKVLESVKEFIKEGDTHIHCVFTNEYYKKEDSLIFSASISGKLTETIEVSLSEMKITQSRGFDNKASIYNKRILALMSKNMHVIRKRHREIHKIKVMVGVKQMEAA